MLLGAACPDFHQFLMSSGHLDIPHNPKERQEMYEVFDSTDFDQSFVKCYRAA